MKTPSIPRSVRIVFAVLYLGFLFYSIIIVQQLLIGILLPLLLTGLGYGASAVSSCCLRRTWRNGEKPDTVGRKYVNFRPGV